MEINFALSHIDRLSEAIRTQRGDLYNVHGLKWQVAEFIKSIVGEKNSFFVAAHTVAGSQDHIADMLLAILRSLREYLTTGLLGAIGPERKAQIDVVSDLLDQANVLLNSNGVHPAAHIMIVAASLEQILTTSIERESIYLSGKKPSQEV